MSVHTYCNPWLMTALYGGSAAVSVAVILWVIHRFLPWLIQ